MGKAGALLAAGMMVWGLLWGEKEVLAAGTGKLEVRSGEAQIQGRGEVSLHKAVFPGEQSGGGGEYPGPGRARGTGGAVRPSCFQCRQSNNC